MLNLKTFTKPISKGLDYHLTNNISLSNNIYRYASPNFCKLICEVRDLYNNEFLNLTEDELFWINGDTCKEVIIDGNTYILDLPIVREIIDDSVYLDIFYYENDNINSIELVQKKGDIFFNEHPYIDNTKTSDNIDRTFESTIDQEDLKWHFDNENRKIILKEETDWLIQFDNSLPEPIYTGMIINKDIYHRLIKGNNNLNIEIIIF